MVVGIGELRSLNKHSAREMWKAEKHAWDRPTLIEACSNSAQGRHRGTSGAVYPALGEQGGTSVRAKLTIIVWFSYGLSWFSTSNNLVVKLHVMGYLYGRDWHLTKVEESSRGQPQDFLNWTKYLSNKATLSLSARLNWSSISS